MSSFNAQIQFAYTSNNHITWRFNCLFLIIVVVFYSSCNSKDSSDTYKGSAYSDEVFKISPQSIPGKLQCEYYDDGGEGVAYHDIDSHNNGSGNLNKGADYLSNFRKNEAVDISFTKFHDSIDNSKYNFVQPEESQLYIGWTAPGEWTKYTVEVKKPGLYQVGIMYTANDHGQISLAINDVDVTGPQDILSTFVKDDSLDWRQWHHWNYLENINEIGLQKECKPLLYIPLITDR